MDDLPNGNALRNAELDRLRLRILELERAEIERARVAVALRESEERFRTLVANVPGAVYRSEAREPWRDAFISDGILALTGYRAADFMRSDGPTFGDLILPEDRPIVVDAVNRAITRGGTFEVRYRLRRADGGIRWMHDHGRVAKSPDGTPLWLDGVVLDITDQMRVEEALRESEQRFRTLVGNVPGVVYRCEVRFPYRDLVLSEGVRSLTGQGPEVFVGPDAVAFGDLILPEDRPAVEESADRAVEEHRSFEVRYRIRHAGGDIRWVQEQGRATYAPDGTPLWLDGVMVDVTDRMRAEAALKASQVRLVEAQHIAHIGSWELDLQTEGLIWSDEHYHIFELDRQGFGATYEAFLAVVHPEDRERVHRAYTESVQQHSPYDVVHRLLMPGGTVKWVHERAETFYDHEGRPTRTAGTVQDITEQHEVEEARQLLETQLRQAHKMEAIGTLAGGIAHDFNNILAAVIGHAELLAHELSPQNPSQERVAGILSASKRARGLVQQILTFGRRREQERRLIALPPVVLEALKLLRPTLPTTIEIRTTIPDESAVVLADPTQVHQAVVNLCTNAAHAMADRRGVLELGYETMVVEDSFAGAHPGLRPGVHARLTVRDSGKGMDAPTLERIFDPFFTTKSPGEGTGLGLAVVDGIMRSHDGAVTVESRPGQGSLFSLYFPIVQGPSAPEAAEGHPIPRGRGEHVLVVDDEPPVVRIASQILQRLGYRVTAHNGSMEALADFQSRPEVFDLVLSDLTMPNMTGLDLAARLLARRPELPVLLTSGYSGSLEPDRLRQLGIREVVEKPYFMRTLAEAVHRHLRSPA